MSEFHKEIEDLCEFDDLNRTVYIDTKINAKVTWYGHTDNIV